MSDPIESKALINVTMFVTAIFPFTMKTKNKKTESELRKHQMDCALT